MDTKLQHYHKYEGRQVVALCATCHCFPRYVLTDKVRLWCPQCGAVTQKFTDVQGRHDLIMHWNKYQRNANLLPVCSNKIHALRVKEDNNA